MRVPNAALLFCFLHLSALPHSKTITYSSVSTQIKEDDGIAPATSPKPHQRNKQRKGKQGKEKKRKKYWIE